MNTKRRNTMVLRFSIFTGVLIGLYWLIFYLVEGYVPVVSTMEIESWSFEIHFAVSRWADILIGPIGSVIVIWQYAKTASKTVSRNILISGLGLGLAYALIFGPNSLKFGLLPILVFGWLLGSVIFIIFDRTHPPDSTIFAKGYLISLTLGFTLLFGLPYILMIGLASGMIYIIWRPS